MDCSLPGSSIHGIFQARVLEWIAIAFSDEAWQLPLLSWNQPPWYKVLDQDYWIMRNNTDREVHVKSWSTQKREGGFWNLWSWPRQPRGYLSERHQPTPMEYKNYPADPCLNSKFIEAWKIISYYWFKPLNLGTVCWKAIDKRKRWEFECT